MKFFFPSAILVFATICLATSCKKEKPPVPVSSSRTLRFIFYTNQDFSTDADSITVSLYTSTESAARFDSVVFAARVKDIPDKAHELVFEKKIPDDGKLVTAGFVYSIENVGYSWHLDTMAANEKLKVIEYPFQ